MLERDAKLREITEIDAPESSVTIPSAQCVESELLATLTRSLCKGSESSTTPTANKRDMLCVVVVFDCYFPEFGCGVDGLKTGPTKASLCASDILVTSTNLKLPMSGTGAIAGGAEASAELPLVPLPPATAS